MFSGLGSVHLHKKSQGNTDFRLKHHLHSNSCTNLPPDRVKPVPITIIIYTGMLIGHDEDVDNLIDGITWWTMSNQHYFKEKVVQAKKVVDCV
jgi:hypothetical protein